MIGWLTWALLSLGHAWSGWCWSASHFGTSRSAVERVMAAMVFAFAGLVGVELLCAAFHVFAPPALLAASLVWFAVTFFATRDARPHTRLLADLSRLVLAAREPASPLFLALPLAVVAFAASCGLTYLFRAWNYDGTVYHTPIAYLFVHHGALEWPGLRNAWIEGYPFDVSLLSAWNIVFTRDKVFDDAAQLPFVLLACTALASWCRFVGASRATSLTLGASFILLTPVWLQSMHTQVDIACAALFLSTTRVLVEPATRGRFLVVACAMGLYVGTKFTGALHLVALLPWIVFWARPLGLSWAFARGATLIAGLGGARYLVNVLAHGSPFWPFSMRVPLLGVLPGPVDPGPINLAASHSSGAFFGAPNSIAWTAWNWFHDDAALWPDVRDGGFGLVFRWLLLPCLALLVLDVLRRRANTRRALPVVAVCVLALVVPMPWWPRYTLAAGGMGLVALASVLTADRLRTWSAWAVSLVFVGLLMWTWLSNAASLLNHVGEYRWPGQIAKLRKVSPEERERNPVTTWLWPADFIAFRDLQFADGGVLLYDESADYLSEFFARGLRNTPRFASSVTPSEFLAEVDATNACWVFVTENSKLEDELKKRNMQLLFAAPRTNGRMWNTRKCR